MKNGKKPLSSKPKPMLQESDIFGSPFTVDADLKAEISAKDLECRWVDYKLLAEMGGYHRRGWRAYKRDKKEDTATLSNQEFLLGSSPDGLIRRGTMVLAVRPVSVGDKHRQLNRNNAAIYQNHTKSEANDLRKIAREAGVDTKIHEGYEDPE